LLGYQITWY